MTATLDVNQEASSLTVETAESTEAGLDVLQELIHRSGDDTASISQFVQEMTDRGYTREDAVETLHRQIGLGRVALTNLFQIQMVQQ